MGTARHLARIQVAGPDQKGIIATVTTYLFKNKVNIEDIDQRILDEILVMNMVVDITDLPVSLPQFREGLKTTAGKMGMEATFQLEEKRRIKNVVLLVTKEPHCLTTLCQQMKAGKIKGKPVMILANRPDLKGLAKKFNVPFHYYPSDNRQGHEAKVLEKLAEMDVDLIVLARYMQILSPNFCFRYEGKVINIHPSLLPAFPGARPYSQAYHKGVEVVGVTAHFVTTDLDQGPIISQDVFKVNKNRDSIETMATRGKQLEAKVLARAVKLFCEERLTLRRGKVTDSRQAHQFDEKVKEFYR